MQLYYWICITKFETAARYFNPLLHRLHHTTLSHDFITWLYHTTSSHDLITWLHHTTSSHDFITRLHHTTLSHDFITWLRHTASSHNFITRLHHTTYHTTSSHDFITRMNSVDSDHIPHICALRSGLHCSILESLSYSWLRINQCRSK
jgi:hypothetical protein